MVVVGGCGKLQGGGDAGVGQVRAGEQRREDERRQTIFDEREPRRTSLEATSEREVVVVVGGCRWRQVQQEFGAGEAPRAFQGEAALRKGARKDKSAERS